MQRRTKLPMVALVALAALGVTAAAADTRATEPEIRAVEPAQIVDAANPPAPPPEKAGAAENEDLLRDVRAPEPHLSHDDPAAHDDDVDWATNPDAWVCVGPGDVGHARIVALPSIEILKSMRAHVNAQRAKDSAWMPIVEYDAAPPGCEPIEGKPSLEDFDRKRTVLAVLHADGSLKTLEELKAMEAGS